MNHFIGATGINDIYEIESDIVDLQALTNNHTFEIEDLTNLTGIHTGNIEDLTTLTTDHTTQLTSLTDLIAVNTGNIEDLTTLTGIHTTQLTSLTDLTGIHTGNIEDLTTLTADHTTQLTSLTDLTGIHSGAIYDLNVLTNNHTTNLIDSNSYLYKDANGRLILYSDKNTGDDDDKNDNFRFSFKNADKNDEIDSKTRINTTNGKLEIFWNWDTTFTWDIIDSKWIDILNELSLIKLSLDGSAADSIFGAETGIEEKQTDTIAILAGLGVISVAAGGVITAGFLTYTTEQLNAILEDVKSRTWNKIDYTIDTTNYTDLYWDTGNVSIGTVPSTKKLEVLGKTLLTGILDVNGNTIITGNVAIGKEIGSYKLDVEGDIKARRDIYSETCLLSTNIEDIAVFTHKYKFNANDYGIKHSADGTLNFNSVLGKSIIFNHDNVNKMILKDGNLGIGNTEPVNKLDVIGDTNILGHLSLSYNTDPFFTIVGPIININQNTDNDILAVKQVIYNRFHINNGGNVGIGNSQPEYTLDVDGTIRANGNLIITGNVGIGISTPPAVKLDVNYRAHIGDALIGNRTITDNHFAQFRNKLVEGDNNYAIAQSYLGTTLLNTKSGYELMFCESGESKMSLYDGILHLDKISKLNEETLNIEKYCIIGAAAIGNYNNLIDERFAEFRHKSITNELDYAIGQWDTGMTVLNCAVSQPIHCCEDGFEKMVLKNGKFGIGLDTGIFPANTFEVVDYATIGAVSLGNWKKTDTDYAVFKHKSLADNSTTDYALLQSSGGNTYLNSKIGTSIFFRENNVTKASLTNGTFNVVNSITANKLTTTSSVTSTSISTGTISTTNEVTVAPFKIQNVINPTLINYANIYFDTTSSHLFIKTLNNRNIRFFTGSTENINISTTLVNIKLDTKINATLEVDNIINNDTKINNILQVNNIYNTDNAVIIKFISGNETSIYGRSTSPIKFYHTSVSGVNFLLGTFTSGGSLIISGSYTPSDIRVKTNIQNNNTDIETFKKISIKQIDRIDNDKKNQVGVIAQEIKEFYPDLIEIGTQLNDESVQDFNYIKPDDLIYHLISVVQQ